MLVLIGILIKTNRGRRHGKYRAELTGTLLTATPTHATADKIEDDLRPLIYGYVSPAREKKVYIFSARTVSAARSDKRDRALTGNRERPKKR